MRRTFLLPLLALAACQQGPASPAPEAAARSARAVPAPGRPAPAEVDLGPALERLRRAVRRDGDRLVARGEHHDLSVDAAGRFQVAARGEASAELSLETVAASRGGRGLLGRAAVRAEGAVVVLARGAVEERLENGAAGVEQRWHLASRPAGPGDLTLSVKVAGLPYAGVTAGGLHFGDPARGAMVRYGLATLVDAAGRRTPLATRFAGGAIRITVPEAALEAAAFPAVIDPVIGPEQAVDAPPGGLPASGAQGSPSLACLDPSNCLVAWQDRALEGYGGGWQLRAARYNPQSGVRLDPDGLDLDTTPGSFSEAPLVVAVNPLGGTEWLVVYRRTDNLGAGATRRRLMAARVSASGVVLGSPLQLSSDAFGDVGPFSAATSGTSTAVVWSDLQQVRFTLVSNGAVAVSSTPFPKPTLPPQTWWGSPAIAFTNNQWMVAWRSTYVADPPRQAISFGYLDALGNPAGGMVFTAMLGPNTGAAMDFLGQPVLASDGGSAVLMLVPVSTGTEPLPGRVLAMRFNTAGLSDPEPWPLPVNGLASGQAWGLGAWFDGLEYQVVLEYPGGNGRKVALQAVSLDASAGVGVTPPLGLPVQLFPAGGALTGARVVSTASGLVTAWEDLRNGPADVRAALLLPPADSLQTATLLTTGGADEDYPAAAYTGGQWLVAWQDARRVSLGASSDVWATRLAQADGAILDPGGLRLSDAGPALGRAQGRPVAAGAGGRFLVAWSDDRTVGNSADVYATQVTTAGAVSPAGGAAVAASTLAEWPLSAAWDGADFQILYREEPTDLSTPPLLRTARMSPGGVVRAPLTVASASSQFRHLQGRLACTTTAGCLVGWSEELSAVARAQVVSGGALAGPPLAVPTAVNAPAISVSAIDGLGVPYLLAWPEPDFTGNLTAVKGALVAQDGTLSASLDLLSGVTGSAAQGAATEVALVADGTSHVAAWSPTAGGLWLEWLLSDGTARAQPAPLDTTSAAIPFGPLATASDGEGRTLVAYTVFDPTPGVRAKRVRVRLASFAKLLGQPCSGVSECASGQCVEGVCCDSACGGGANACLTCSGRNGHGTPGRCTAAMGDACNDGQACTRDDRCDLAGACGGSPYTCTATQCQASVACDGAGGCIAVNRPDDTPCDDGGSCTHGDRCTGGACGGTPITCAPTQCQLSALCNGTATCSVVNRTADQGCSDGDPCTVNDHCDGSGGCTPGPAKVCPDLSDPCKGAGTCDHADGTCVYVAANEGAPCPGGTCRAGSCALKGGAIGEALGMSCSSGPGGAGALLLALLALASRRARRSA